MAEREPICAGVCVKKALTPVPSPSWETVFQPPDHPPPPRLGVLGLYTPASFLFWGAGRRWGDGVCAFAWRSLEEKPHTDLKEATCRAEEDFSAPAPPPTIQCLPRASALAPSRINYVRGARTHGPNASSRHLGGGQLLGRGSSGRGRRGALAAPEGLKAAASRETKQRQGGSCSDDAAAVQGLLKALDPCKLCGGRACPWEAWPCMLKSTAGGPHAWEGSCHSGDPFPTAKAWEEEEGKGRGTVLQESLDSKARCGAGISGTSSQIRTCPLVLAIGQPSAQVACTIQGSAP